jgi:hypothetical protein
MDSRNPRDVHAVVPQKGNSEPDQDWAATHLRVRPRSVGLNLIVHRSEFSLMEIPSLNRAKGQNRGYLPGD